MHRWAAVLASLVLHALVLCVPLALSSRAVQEPVRFPDNWAARSVEVGTVPDVRDTEPEAPLAPPQAAPPREQVAPADAPVEAPDGPREPALPPRVGTPPSVTAPRPSAAVASIAPSSVASGASSAAASVSSAAMPGADAARDGESTGSLGAVGLPPGVRHLATAFTRALPAGGYKDAAWSELPLGPLGEASVHMEVSEGGELGRVEVEPDQGLPPALDRMLKRVVLLLRSGTFSLDPRQVRGGGREHLEIKVTIATRPPNPDELAAPGDLFAQSFMAPKPGAPGYARFTLNSGRHIEAVVRYAPAAAE